MDTETEEVTLEDALAVLPAQIMEFNSGLQAFLEEWQDGQDYAVDAQRDLFQVLVELSMVLSKLGYPPERELLAG